MKFRQYGFKNETIEVREMTMGDVVLTISQALIRKDVKDMEIRIVDCFMGTVESYAGLDDLIMHDFNTGWKVSVYDMCVMHDNVTNKDFLKVILADNIELMD